MDNSLLLKIINSIREKSEREKLVVFVGSGVSRNVDGFPSWYELVDNMASAVGYSKCTSCKSKKTDCEKTCLLKKEYSTDEFLKIPQYLYNSDETLYLETLKNSIVDINVDAPLSSAIFDVNPDHIITTNYDRLLEYSKNEYRNQYDVIIDDKALLSSEKSKFIIKMHGDIHDLNTIVLKEQDYLDYSQKHVLIELFVKSLLTDHTVLFLGYSLNDYNIKLIISWLNYMRLQNDALGEGQKVGYIIMDEDVIPSDEISYFSNNNIEVVNIHNMPLVTTIPFELMQDKGKRLYSFLKSIAEPSIAANTFYYDYLKETINFMSEHIFVNYKTILDLLFIKRYEKKDTNIRIHKEEDYKNISEFFELESEVSIKLKKVLVNAGITSFSFVDFPDTKTVEFGNIADNALLSDSLFQLYIINDYAEIMDAIDSEKNILKKSFYKCIIGGYSQIYEYYESIDFNLLSSDEKVAYLHNYSILRTFNDLSIPFNSKDVKKYIENVTPLREKRLYDEYLNIYNGSPDALFEMNQSYDKIKASIHQKHTIVFGGVPWSNVLDIQNYAYNFLEFYFYNYILFYGFSDLKKCFKPYISAIICANSEQEEKSYDMDVFSTNNEKYFINKIDFNIITKFISTKDLYNLLNEFSIIQLNTSPENIRFLANCFNNLCASLITKQTYGFWDSSYITLSNLVLIFNRLTLDESSKSIIPDSIKAIMNYEDFYKRFFSIHYPDNKICIKEFSTLFNELEISFEFNTLKAILKNEEFFTFAVNVNFYSLKNIVNLFFDKESDSQNDLKEIIDNETDFNKKIILLQLFYSCFNNELIIANYKEFLTENFLKLSRNAKYDFVFNRWVNPSQEDLQTFIENIIKTAENQKPGVRSFPDPVDSDLEVVYIFYMDDIINDISSLEPLAEGRPILQFLLHPHNFDYSQVDFSYYMWDNFARRPKFMQLFVEHKQDIIPKMKKRVERDEATDFEKRVLYGFFMSEDEVLDN